MDTGCRRTGRIARLDHLARRPEALGRLVDRSALAHLRPHVLLDLQRAGSVHRRRDRAGQDPDAVLGLILVRLPLEAAGVVDAVDVVLAGLEVDEREPVRLRSPGEHRREGRDALGAGVEVGELVELVAVEIVQEDVAHPVAVGHERQGLAVGAPLRAHVLAVIHAVEHPHRAGGQVEQRDAEVARGERAEVGLGAAIGREGDAAAVGRPDRVEVGVLVLRELPQPAPVAIDDVEIAEAALVPGEDELLAVGAPGGSGDAAQLELDALHFLVAVHVHDEDVVPGTSLRREGEILPVRRPVRLRVDEPVRLVVAADAGLEDPPVDLAGDAVGEVQVHRVEILLAEVRDPRPVRREGGGEVQRPVRPLLGQQLVCDRPGPAPARRSPAGSASGPRRATGRRAAPA